MIGDAFLMNLLFQSVFFPSVISKEEIREDFFKIFFQLFFFSYLVFFFKIILDDYLYNVSKRRSNIIFVITICILSDIGGYFPSFK